MIREFAIILGVTYLGDFLSRFAPIPLPGPVIGLLILFLLLVKGVVKVENIKAATGLMLGNLAFLFLPPGVGLINSLEKISGSWGKLLFLIVSTTVVTMLVTGWTVQFMMGRPKEKKIENQEEAI